MNSASSTLPSSKVCAIFGMDEARRELGLVDEHRVVGLVVDQVRQQPLDHDLLLEPVLARRGRDEQLGHAADGQPLDELVPAEADREVTHRRPA